jgi:triphosphoribosyl-dephospho-CoA synthase
VNDRDGSSEQTASNEQARTPAENAELALLLELAGTPKPGNVDRRREYPDLRFEHFLAGAVGARDGLSLAAEGEAVGRAFERAVAGMARQRGGNTQLGCLLLLVPLVKARAERTLSREGAAAVVGETTVEDAVGFYRAFDHVDVAVPAPADVAVSRSEDAADRAADLPPELDVRRGSDAVPAVRERGLDLLSVLELSADHDGNAREWAAGFPRTFAVAEALLADEGSAPDRVARAFLRQLASEPDTLVATQHGEAAAQQVRERAADLVADGVDLEAVEQLAEEFVAEDLNPGTTADLVAAGTYVALERGLPV